MAEPDTPSHPPAALDDADNPSLATLARRLGADASTLARQEIALAKAELRQGARSLASHAGKLAAGAVTALAGALVLVQALVLGLGDALDGRYWLASLIVGVLLLAAGAGLLLAGVRGARAQTLAPERTLATLRETGDWARAEASALRSSLTGPGDGGAMDADTGGRVAVLAPSRGDRLRGVDAAAADADGRAPAATGTGSPAKDAEAPPLAWPLWKRVWTRYKNDDVANQAAKVAYFFFMSLPPLLMATFGLAGIFGGDGTAAWLTDGLRRNLPAEAGTLVNGFVTEVVRKEHPGLVSIGLLLALWAGANVFMALEDTLNVAWGVRQQRGFVKRRAMALGTLLAVGLLFLAGSAALLAGPAIAKALGLGLAWTVLQYPLGLAMVVAAFWVVYFVLPNRDQRRHKGVLLKSSAIAAGLWLLATLAFRLYAANFASYDKTYGVLGGMIVLLLWMDYTSLVILLGGEIASEMARSR
ncbi:MAG TPA: YhjD/YihY/BrkB family envelope integrity protein [Longimicrobium sp.]|nr:YhjD/YihY/BrkB family envelope integrity protein [Longimicrobium sp.]